MATDRQQNRPTKTAGYQERSDTPVLRMINLIQAAAPGREFDGEYGNGFIKNTAFIGMLYKGMAGN